MNIVVTGSCSGIGFELTKLFLADQEHHVMALGIDERGLASLHQLDQGGTQLDTLCLNFLNYSSAKIQHFTSHVEAIHVLINNAGVVMKEDFANLDLEKWREVFEINFFGAVQIIQDLLPKLFKANSAHIVNIGSIGGFQGSVKFADLAAYSASKAALANLTESLAVAFAAQGVSVNCLCPGAVDTKMFRAAFSGYSAQLESKEMAKFIHDFSLEGNKYFNGKILPVSLSTP